MKLKSPKSKTTVISGPFMIILPLDLTSDHPNVNAQDCNFFTQPIEGPFKDILQSVLHQDSGHNCLKAEREGKKTLIAEVLKWLKSSLSAYKEERLSVGILVAVLNESERGLYRMNGKGKQVKDDILATGSGSGAKFILMDGLGHFPDFDAGLGLPFYKRKCSLSVTEAADLAKKALCYAADTAPHHGDIVTVYHLGSEGCKKLLEDDIEAWTKENIKCQRMRYEVFGKGW
ncbi:OLC1v1012711C1 [Oldenlandia corymbosa var. corymbosa]|uniref:OLC1v1012711C1 n=1 Tax=Oldenlandia corymbosa var. corymbosa TaxID=529605 RepID=A0AAV1DZS9_OLDCO|nr:OLC1v1012711C1 [Oldenlandia corymbosa var. corymbosa]